MLKIFEDLIETIEKNAVNNTATITNVQLWVESWKKELETYISSDLSIKQLEKIASINFKDAGDEGLFPNYTDKDIWMAGFVDGIRWLISNKSNNV